MVTTSNFIDINRMHLHYYAAGQPDAPAVVLLHGGGIDSAKIAWRHLIPELAKTHRVYALDLPAYGESDPPPDDVTYTQAFLERTVADFMAALGLGQVSIVGLSMGGGAALGYTLAQPARVEQLVLVDAYGVQDEAPFHLLSHLAVNFPGIARALAWRLIRANRLFLWAGLSRIFVNPLAATGQVLDDAAESIRLEHFYEWLNNEMTADGCRTNYYPQLHTLTTPTLLVHGQFDLSIPLNWAERAADALPNGRLEIIPWCGHWVNREKPEDFNAVVLPFLQGVTLQP